jgi:DNA-binding protein HU-beta
MNKAELIDIISEKIGETKATATRFLEAFQECITTSLQNDEPVVLTNFCTITVSPVAERTGRNPSTGEEIKIKAGKRVKFKVGKALKDAVKGG